ncbi:MAG: murein hydrolase activator EnvC family protein [Fidelibacterota bacterium]
MKLNRICFTALLCGLTLVPLRSQRRDFQQEIQRQDQAIQSLQKEIEATRKRIARERQKEQSTAQKIANLEQEISLLDQLLSRLNQELATNEARIRSLEKDITAMEKELAALRERYARRVVNVYQKGSLSPLEALFSSTSWRQAIYRSKYLTIISDLDRANQQRLNSLIIDIGQQKLSYEAAVRKSARLKREQEKQKADLQNLKRQKEKDLRKIKRNKAELAELVREKQAGVKQLESVRQAILKDKDRFEREERLRKQREALQARKFSELKGHLPWPADGRIITSFGRQWNPKLKTTTESPGIDIKGKPGSPITAVMNGIVISITFIRGYGTTLILDHGNGYFTVYSHVTNIQVSMDNQVRSGDVLAYMGDSGSVNGAMLHFEIWGQDQKLNPEQWLLQRP